jgi:protein-tyrosine-phosphatase
MKEKGEVLVYCRQNVNRSQIGEGYLREHGGKSGHRFISAGYDQIGEMKRKYSNHPHPQAIDVMAEDGINIADQTIDEMTEEMLERAVLAIDLTTQEEKSDAPEYLSRYQHKIKSIDVEDIAPGTSEDIPIFDVEKFRLVRDQIKIAMLQLLAEGFK